MGKNKLKVSEDFVFTDERKELVDKYIKYTVDGILIDNEEELRTLLSNEEYNFVKYGIELVYNVIKEYTLVLNHDQSAYVTIQEKSSGGKINRSEVKYWGIRRYNNQANTKKAADSLIKNGKQLKSFGSIPSWLLDLLGVTGAVLATIAGAINLGSSFGNWIYSIGTQLRSKNNTYGTVLDINWVANYKVWKQTSTTR